MTLIEALFVFWSALDVGAKAPVSPQWAPPSEGVLFLEKRPEMIDASNGDWELAASSKVWGHGGPSSQCTTSIAKGAGINQLERSGIDSDISVMFLLAHEVGHCADVRPRRAGERSSEQAEIVGRREVFADAFASCLMIKAKFDLDARAISNNRKASLPINAGSRQKAAIRLALSDKRCEASRPGPNGGQEDFLDAQAVADEIEAKVFNSEPRIALVKKEGILLASARVEK